MSPISLSPIASPTAAAPAPTPARTTSWARTAAPAHTNRPILSFAALSGSRSRPLGLSWIGLRR